MKLNSILLALVAFFAMALPRLHAATHSWTGASGDGKWSTAFNWAGNSPPVVGEMANVILQFPPAGSKNTTNDIAGLTIDQIQVSGDNYRIAGAGAGANVTLRSGNVLSSTFFISGAGVVLTNFTFTFATNLNAYASATVATGDTATFRCRFTGPGGFIKRASGTLILDGNAANTYAGLTEIQGGTLQLSQVGNAIPGDLVIGFPGITNLAAVELLTPNQVADGADVFVNYNGAFNPSFFTDTIRSITLSNANLVAGTGLTLGGDFTSIGTNLVTGTVLLGGSDRTFDVTGHLTANVFIGNAVGFAGIIKAGSGTMELGRTNSYNGTTTINAGTLRVAHSGGLGTAAIGTQVNPGATLEIAGGITMPAEQLFLSGFGHLDRGGLILGDNARLNGNIQLSGDTSVCVAELPGRSGFILSQITGGGSLHKTGVGRLFLQGTQPNSFNGAEVQEGELWLGKAIAVPAVTGSLRIGQGLGESVTARAVLNEHHQIADSTAVFIDSDGELDMSPFGFYTDVIGTLTLNDGTVKGPAGTLILKGDVTVTGSDASFDYSKIESALSLGGATRTFLVESGGSLTVLGPISDGGNASGLIKAGQGVMSLYTNNTYSGSTVVNEGLLNLVYGGATLGSTNAGTFVHGSAELRLQQGAAVTNESLILDGLGAGTPRLSALMVNVWAGPIAIQSAASLEVGYGANDSFEIRGAVTGAGALSKAGAGKLIMSGPADNTLAGRLTFPRGTLELRKTGGAVAISGPLTIGHSLDTNAAAVRLFGNNQIDNGVTPLVYPNGILDLNAFNDTMGGLSLMAGTVTSGSGTLTLLGDVNVTNRYSPNFLHSFINGRLALGGAGRTFNIGDNNATLTVSAEISDGGGAGGITKLGDGRMILTVSNSFTGSFQLGGGFARILHPNALGSVTGDTVVSNGAALEVRGGFRIAGESLSLTGVGPGNTGALQAQTDGTNVWAGPITLVQGSGDYGNMVSIQSRDVSYGPNSTFIVDGRISGSAALDLDAQGTMIFAGNGSNTFTSQAELGRGRLILAKTNGIAIPAGLRVGSYYDLQPQVELARGEQIGDEAWVDVLSDGHLNLAGFMETIGSLEGAGAVNAGTGTLRVGLPDSSASSTFSGAITGSGSGTNLVKLGASTQILAGHNPFDGTTHLLGGVLVMNGSNVNTSVFITNNATLAGIGTISDLIVNSGTVSPGATTNGASYGKLTALGNVTFKTGSKLRIKLGGTIAGTNHDQFVAGGQFNLAGGALEAVLAPGATAMNDQFFIVKTLFNNPPSGTFLGLAESGIVSVGNYHLLTTYSGGDGNDIVLTQIGAPAPATMSGIQKLPNGQIQISGSGIIGATYEVQANSDLNTNDWVKLGSVAADWNGAISFVDPDAAQFQMRFYRFVLP